LSIDVSEYIDHTNKKIRSVTGELEWDYGIGVATVNTPASQGATGRLNSLNRIELNDVVIESNNEFGTVVVVALDGQPIQTSKRLLIQAMTEDKAYGFRSEPVLDGSGSATGEYTITALGTGPMNVKAIDTSVVLKGMDDILQVFVLDQNGYYRESVTGQTEAEGYRIDLLPDAIYTIVERTGIEHPSEPVTLPAEDPVYVWWEGENTIEDNFPETSHFAPETLPDTKHLLSGSDWLTVDVDNWGDREGAPYAAYEIEVPEDAEYTLYVRKFWHHGPFYWRFDEAPEWSYLGWDITLLDDVYLRQFINANWVSMGSVHLTAGKHKFEIRMDENYDFTGGFDCFLLTKQPFMPSGLLKPGEKLNLAEEGWFAFEPDFDPFAPSSLIDLSRLNEETAGQNGFVQRDGDKFLLGNGEEVKFWGVNVGTDVLNLEKPDVQYLAKKLAKYGVNLVRIHGKIFDENGEISPKALDRYHYFVSAMKEQGIYVVLSYYFVLWWDMRNAQEFQQPGEQFSDGTKEPFGLLLFNKKQQELYKKGVRKLLETPNPYAGGLPLAQDPAVAMIEIQNEGNYLFWTFADWRYPDKIKQELYGYFGDWLTEKYGSIDNAYEAWGPLQKAWNDTPEQGLMEVEGISSIPWATGQDGDSKRRRDILQFLTESQRAFYEEMTEFYREEIGAQSLLIASNWITAEPRMMEALERYTYDAVDVVDRHGYFDPGHTATNDMYWTIQVGDRYKPRPAVLNPDLNPVKVVHNDAQPSMISEITWTNPTPYGAEGPFMLAVYGSLQGIDALDMFAVGNPAWLTKWTVWPVMSSTMMGQFPAFALMYRRGDIAEAPNVVLDRVSLDSLYRLEGTKIFESLNLDQARQQ
jgi:hypothetical protein